MLASKYEYGVNNRGYRLDLRPGNVIALIISPDGSVGSGNRLEVSPPFAMSTGTWYHVAGKFDPSTEKAVLVNGNKTTAATALALLNVTDFANLQIGGRDDNAGGSTENMTGRVCFAFLCCTVLPDSTIQSLYHQTRAMFGV